MSASYNFPLRLDDELREKLRLIAIQHSRSLNKEIEYIVRQYVQAYEKENGPVTIAD